MAEMMGEMDCMKDEGRYSIIRLLPFKCGLGKM